MLDSKEKRMLLGQFKNTESLTYYKTLAVSRNATDDQIKNAYRRQIIKNHPDKIQKHDIYCGFHDCRENLHENADNFDQFQSDHDNSSSDEETCCVEFETYEERFSAAMRLSQLLNEAHDILSDFDKRAFYDDFLCGGADVSDSEDGYDEDFDIFEHIRQRQKMKRLAEDPGHEAYEVHERSWFYRFVILPVVIYCIAYHWLVPRDSQFRRYAGLV